MRPSVVTALSKGRSSGVKDVRALLKGLLVVTALACSRAHAQEHVKIGILSDESGVYAETSGPGGIVAAQIAIDEFQAQHPQTIVELVTADHQNKPDVAIAIAGRWIDTEGVDMIADLQNSSIAVAVQQLAGEKHRITITTAAVTPELYGKSCTPTGLHWAMDAYSLAIGPVRALSDKKKWYFITVDLAGGHLFEDAGVAAVQSVGGSVVGHGRHPLGTMDMSSYLLNAQALGAQAIGLANAGTDAINSIKGANEFGLIASGIAIAPLLFHDSDVRATGLTIMQGMVFGTNYYWDMNDQTRAFAKTFFARFNKIPTDYQANLYASVRHYLRAVAASHTTESGAVMKEMRALPIELFGTTGTLRPDGRVTYDTYVAQVKKPAESTSVWDTLKIVSTIPADKAFLPLSDSTCPLLKQ